MTSHVGGIFQALYYGEEKYSLASAVQLEKNSWRAMFDRMNSWIIASKRSKSLLFSFDRIKSKYCAKDNYIWNILIAFNDV